MRHHVRLVGFLVGMIAAAFELQACVSDAEVCEQNGTCVKGGGGVGGAGSAGNSGGNGGTTTTVPCSDHPECGGTCEGGVPQFTPAGVLCNNDVQVCDGEGNCVACEDNTHPCPQGYECNGGVCGLSPGGPCSDNTMCASGFCVGGHCCADECEGNCRSCNADTGFSCVLAGYLSNVPTCNGPGEVCDGAGNCKLLGGNDCTADDQCLTNKCNAGMCTTPPKP